MNLAEFVNTMINQGLEYFRLYYGIYEGVVVDNNDPEKLGRLKVTIPKITSNSITGWIHGSGLPVGRSASIAVLPKVGDAVWIRFENGNARYPIWGYGWGFKEAMPKAFTEYADGIAIRVGEARIDIRDDETITIFKGSNKIESKDDEILLDNGTSDIKLDSSVNLGGSQATAVRAEELITLLEATMDALAAATTIVAGVPVPLTNAAVFTGIKTQLNIIKSLKVKLS